MASPSRNNATGSTSPSKRHSRVADAVQVAPYLTHVIRHHGQVTLIPPENSGRIRKEKKKRPGLRGVNSSSSPDLPRLLGTRSRPNTPRPISSSSLLWSRPDLDGTPRIAHTRSRNYQNRSQEEDLRIPDFPPPSFEEAMLATPSPSGSAQGSVVASTQPIVDRIPLDQDVPDLASSSEAGSPRSASSHSSVEDVSDRGHRPLWEEDREAGFSLEERVRRELERRQLSDSLPRAPLMKYFKESKESTGCEDDTWASEADDDISRSQQGSQHASTHKESPGDVSLTVDSQCSNSSQQASYSEPSTSRGDSENMDMDTEGAYMGAKCPVSAKGKEKERTPDEASTSNESRRRETHRQRYEGPFTMIRQALNAPLHLQNEGPDASSIPSPSLLSTLGQPASVDVEQSSGPLHSPADPSSSLVVSSSDCTPIFTPKPSVVASHSDIPNIIPPVASPSPSTTSHSAPVISTVQPNLPLPPSQAPLPTTSATVPPLPPRPPLVSTVVSVRDRISTFESMRKRPVPPPPPLRPVIRRPPPPVPSSSSSRDSFTARAEGELISDQFKSDNAPSLPTRRRMPPPVPPRRSRKSIEATPSELDQRLTPSTVTSTSTAPPSSVSDHSTNVAIVPLTSRDTSEDPVTHALSERIESSEGRREWPSSVGHTQADVVEGDRALAFSSSVEPAILISMTASDVAPIETRDNAVRAAPNNDGTDGTEETASSAVEIEGSQFSLAPALVETSLTETRDTVTPEDTGIIVHSSDVAPERASNGRSGDLDNATFETTPGQEPISEDIPSSSRTAQPLQPMFTGLTDLDLLLARLDDPDFTFSGRSYDDLLLLEEIMGSATGPSDHPRAKLEDIPLGKVEVLRRRVTKDGRTKLKIALFGVIVDKCGICLVQFKEGVFACLLPCQHAFHDSCLRLWMRRGQTCPLCRGPLCGS